MLGLLPPALAAVWPALPPGKPTNLTVLSGKTWASVRWIAASPAAGGGETNHFALKWQYKDAAEAEWYPYWVGPDKGEAMLQSLGSGVTIATRVAAVNQYGRTWSDFVVFSTMSPLVCDEAYQFKGVMETADIEGICGGHEFNVPVDPHRSPCSVTHVEYAFAGVAAGIMVVLLATAIILRACCTAEEQLGSSRLLKSGCVNEPGTISPVVSDGEDLPSSYSTKTEGRLERQRSGCSPREGETAEAQGVDEPSCKASSSRTRACGRGRHLGLKVPVQADGYYRSPEYSLRHNLPNRQGIAHWPNTHHRRIPATPITPHSGTALLDGHNACGPTRFGRRGWSSLSSRTSTRGTPQRYTPHHVHSMEYHPSPADVKFLASGSQEEFLGGGELPDGYASDGGVRRRDVSSYGHECQRDSSRWRAGDHLQRNEGQYYARVDDQFVDDHRLGPTGERGNECSSLAAPIEACRGSEGSNATARQSVSRRQTYSVPCSSRKESEHFDACLKPKSHVRRLPQVALPDENQSTAAAVSPTISPTPFVQPLACQMSARRQSGVALSPERFKIGPPSAGRSASPADVAALNRAASELATLCLDVEGHTSRSSIGDGDSGACHGHARCNSSGYHSWDSGLSSGGDSHSPVSGPSRTFIM